MANTNKESKDRNRTGSYAPTHRQGSTSYQPDSERGSSAITRRDTSGNAFSMMRRLMDDMDHMFNDFSLGGSSLLPPRWSGEAFWTPQIETFRRGEELVVRADLPGMNKENVDVEIDDNALIISGERQDEYNEERDDYYRSERSYGRFYRAVPLPEGADPNTSHAEFKDGVLEVSLTLPRQAEQHRKRIDIK